MLGIIAAKETRIDNDAANNARQAESDDAPIETRRASPPAFPPVHPLPAIGVFPLDKNRRARLQQILFRRKKIVVGKQHRAAEFLRSKID